MRSIKETRHVWNELFTVSEQDEYEDIREIVYNLNVADPIVGSLLQRYQKLRYSSRINMRRPTQENNHDSVKTDC